MLHNSRPEVPRALSSGREISRVPRNSLPLKSSLIKRIDLRRHYEITLGQSIDLVRP